jgi:hypothetical protein
LKHAIRIKVIDTHTIGSCVGVAKAVSYVILMCSMSVHYIVQKTLNTNKCTKDFFITCNTLLHVSTLLGHLQGDLSCVVTLWLHFIVELLIVYCELSVVSACSPDHREFAPPKGHAVFNIFSKLCFVLFCGYKIIAISYVLCTLRMQTNVQ